MSKITVPPEVASRLIAEFLILGISLARRLGQDDAALSIAAIIEQHSQWADVVAAAQAALSEPPPPTS